MSVRPSDPKAAAPLSESLPEPPGGLYWDITRSHGYPSLTVSLYQRDNLRPVASRSVDIAGIVSVRTLRAKVLTAASTLKAEHELDEEIRNTILGEYPPTTPDGRRAAEKRAKAQEEEK